jgi:hypothetical protein
MLEKINNMKKNINNKKNGSALAYGIIMTTVCIIILFSAFQFVVSQIKYGFYLANREEAFQIAETGIQYYHWYLAHETDGKSLSDINDFWTKTNPYPKGFPDNPLEVEYKDKNGTTIGKYKVEVTPPASNSSIVEVVSTGWTNKNTNIIRKIKVRFRRSAWSDYAILIGEKTAFDSAWDVNGKVMGNQGIQFDGVAHNVVSAGVSSYDGKPGVWTKWPSELNTDATPDSQVFLAGKKFPVPQKDFTGIDLAEKKTYALSNGATNGCTTKACYFNYTAPDEGRHIILEDDGKFKISTVQKLKSVNEEIKTETSFETFAIPLDGIIYVQGNVWLEGKIENSRVTIVAAIIPLVGSTYGNVYINGPIEYETKNENTVLGIISQGFIELPFNGPDNFNIDAVLLTQNEEIKKVNYNGQCCSESCKDLKNRIDIYGAIISAKNPLFSFDKECRSGGKQKIGYDTKQVEYDNNLLYFPPPFFPSDSYYLIDLWEES